MKINFYKMCASGNDFIVIDNRDQQIKKSLSKLAKAVCPRRMSVGADGVLVIENSSTHDVRMRIFNADGSEAEMCGNGARCAALFCHQVLGLKTEFVMQTIAGPVHSVVGKQKVKVRLTDPKDFRDMAPIEVSDGIFYFYFLNTGVPHAVIFVESLETLDVAKIGREVRHHDHFRPHGTNVNFVHIIDAKHIAVRTYERGVEDETLACGTGSTASAIVSALIKKCASPVDVATRGGEHLKISFDSHMFDVTNVYLEGKAQIVYQGECDIAL